MDAIKYENDNITQINEILDGCTWGDLAFVDMSGAPEIMPMNYVRLDDWVYFHAVLAEGKRECLERASSFAVVDELSYIPGTWLIPSGKPGIATVFFRSVIVKGRCTFFDETAEKCRILNALADRYQREGGYKIMEETNPGLKKLSVFGVKIEQGHVTCKINLGQNLGLPIRQKIFQNLKVRGGHLDYKSAYLMQRFIP